MHGCNPGEQLASPAFMHHADLKRLIHSRRVGMMHECVMHHVNKGHNALLKQYAALKGPIPYCRTMHTQLLMANSSLPYDILAG